LNEAKHRSSKLEARSTNSGSMTSDHFFYRKDENLGDRQ
jgi:hypothetical protein